MPVNMKLIVDIYYLSKGEEKNIQLKLLKRIL
jgi:hypothetical protein